MGSILSEHILFLKAFPFLKTTRNLNFSNPLLGRKWISLLQHDKAVGIRILPNLNLRKRYLGFSFRSNEFGLRGPSNIYAPNLIIGTSYAMGFSVDNNYNWYDFLNSKNYLNIGIPVGAKQFYNLYKELYRGDHSMLLILYHPNFWIVGKSFEGIKSNIIEEKAWKTDFYSSLKLYKKKYKAYFLNDTSLEIKYFNHRNFLFNNRYAWFDFEDKEFIEEQLKYWNLIVSKFKKIKVYRVPIKEQFLKNNVLNENYDRGWNIFYENTLQHSNIQVFDLVNKFDLLDYLQFDTHWNKSGNLKMYQNL